MSDVEKFDFGSFFIERVECPGITLARGRRKALIDECIPVARKAFGVPVEASDIELHAMRVSTTFFVRDSAGTMVGFASSVRKVVRDREFVYLEGAAVLPEYKGLYKALIAIRLLLGGNRSSSRPLVTTRTQTPVVFKTMVDHFDLYPNLAGSAPEELKTFAEVFSGVVQEDHSDWRSVNGLKFDRENLVVRRAYGKTDRDETEKGFCMYGSIEKVPFLNRDEGDKEKNDFMKKHLDFEDGDAFMMIGEFDAAKTEIVLRQCATAANVPPSQADKLVNGLF